MHRWTKDESACRSDDAAHLVFFLSLQNRSLISGVAVQSDIALTGRHTRTIILSPSLRTTVAPTGPRGHASSIILGPLAARPMSQDASSASTGDTSERSLTVKNNVVVKDEHLAKFNDKYMSVVIATMQCRHIEEETHYC